MEIKTAEGIEIFVLPDCARCSITGYNPMTMMDCPMCRFDPFGDVCIPGECEFYEEVV